jgi:hypothetical protein
MSNRICGKCGSRKVADAGSYAGRSFFKCETCGQMGMSEKFPKMTVFDQITASPEVLAEKLVYRYDGNGTWRSFLLLWYEFLTKEEAIAATVAKLKEVCDA